MKATRRRAYTIVAVCLPLWGAAALALPGCQEAPAEAKKEVKHVGVTVSCPVEQQVVDYEEFTGRVDAVNKVGVQAMVTGYLQEIKFKDGVEVKKNEVLFKIDPRVFQAKANMSKALLEQALAHRDRLLDDYKRNAPLAGSIVSKEDFNKIEGDLLEGKAAVGMAEAQLDQDTVNLDFTNVLSPITGKVSRRLIDKGNMVKANDTMLTWVYEIDPMYAYFDVDERTVIKLRRLIMDGRLKSYRDGKMDVDVGLADEVGFSLKGYVDWVDNVLDAGTGTLKIRAVVPQPRDKSGNPLILVSPGMFVRVKLPTSVPRKTLLIAEKAIGTDQDEKFVFVVDDKNKIERRNVVLGQMQSVKYGQVLYNLRVVERNPPDKGKDLLATDKIVMSGLQRVHAGLTVEPSLIPMPGGVPLHGLLADHSGPAGTGTE